MVIRALFLLKRLRSQPDFPREPATDAVLRVRLHLVGF